jgi:hypothetical protein
VETSITEVPYELFTQKLFALKTQVRLHSSIGQSIEKEIDSIKLLFEEINRVDGATNQANGAMRMLIGSMNSIYGAINRMSDSTNQIIEAMTQTIGVTNRMNDATNSQNGAMNQVSGVTKQANGAKKSNLQKIIIKEVSEKLKISFYFDNIPGRLAKILTSMDELAKMKVAEMRKLTGTSRNSITRDIAILKQLEWIEFIGGRSNGYFILTGAGKNVLAEAETNKTPENRNESL